LGGWASTATRYLISIALAMIILLLGSFFPPAGSIGERATFSFVQAVIIVLVPLILLWFVKRGR